MSRTTRCPEWHLHWQCCLVNGHRGDHRIDNWRAWLTWERAALEGRGC